MKIQTPTEFLTFTDGFCDIYNSSGNRPAGDAVHHLAYGNRTVGFKRFYAARAATTEINLVIQVPQQTDITAVQIVVIENMRYKIEQVQQLYDTNPRVTVLTLHRIGVAA